MLTSVKDSSSYDQWRQCDAVFVLLIQNGHYSKLYLVTKKFHTDIRLNENDEKYVVW